MLFLTSTSDLLQIVTGGTQVLDVHASFIDLNASGANVNNERTNLTISTATTTTIVSSPASNVQRDVGFLSVLNTDTTNAAAISIQHTDGTNVETLFKFSLPPKYVLTFFNGQWMVFDDLGRQQVGVSPSQTLALKTLVYTQVFDNGNSGTSAAIDWTKEQLQKITLTGNVTFTFNSPGGPCVVVFEIAQNGAGGNSITWPATVKWPGGTAPNFGAQGANVVSVVTLFFDGTNYLSQSALAFS